ncbi:MAG: hypothetical protein PQJ46_00050 [Spirochaetales bacterium]|nr:hypothetical protein [Spirochaetales bacterium]
MVLRIWHGWTTLENADSYESLLRTTVFPEIEAMNIKGYQRIRLLKRLFEGNETEFVTIMEFDNLDAVKDFVGEDFSQSYVPEEARKILKRFDEHAQHYEMLENRLY